MPDPDLFHGLLHTASALAEEGMKKEEECPPDNLKGFFHFFWHMSRLEKLFLTLLAVMGPVVIYTYWSGSTPRGETGIESRILDARQWKYFGIGLAVWMSLKPLIFSSPSLDNSPLWQWKMRMHKRWVLIGWVSAIIVLIASIQFEKAMLPLASEAFRSAK